MQNLKQLVVKVIQIQQIHQQAVKHKRELIILLTILAGMLVQYVLYSDGEKVTHDIANIAEKYFTDTTQLWVYYYTKLTVNFLKSSILVILCFYAVLATDSKRLYYGLLFFLVVSMGADLVSIMSTDIYYMIKPVRYLTIINFKDSYFVFEIICILYTLVNWTLDFIQTTIDNRIARHNALCDSSSLSSLFAQKKKTH